MPNEKKNHHLLSYPIICSRPKVSKNILGKGHNLLIIHTRSGFIKFKIYVNLN
jgi:hypothetical protein